MIERSRELVEQLVPADGTVLVVSKGDDALLDLAGRSAWHFPQDPSGAYAGFHPPDSGAAIADLARLRSHGASHLLIPKASLWWLDHYDELRLHLEHTGSLLWRDEEACALYALAADSQAPADRRAA
jgi:hypothetical protein